MNTQKELLKACVKEIGAMVGEQKKLHKELHGSEIKIKELDNKIIKFQKDSKDATKMVSWYRKSLELKPVCLSHKQLTNYLNFHGFVLAERKEMRKILLISQFPVLDRIQNLYIDWVEYFIC